MGIRLLTKPNFIPCPTALMRLAIVKELGGFNSDLTYSEEYVHKIAFKHRLTYIDDPLAKYRLHSAKITGSGSLGTTREAIFILKNWLKGINSQRYIWMIRKRLLELRCKQASQFIPRIYGK